MDAETPPEAKPEATPPSRRGFLQGSIAALAGAAAGAAVGYGIGEARTTPAPVGVTRTPGSPGFDHLVVLMFENRSFDNLLGYLYGGPDGVPVPSGQTFEGLQQAKSNTAPDGTVVTTHPYSGPTDQVMRSPDPDPGEEYAFVNTQLFGRVDPASNSHHDPHTIQPPYNAPAKDEQASMRGFVKDYVDKWTGEHGRAPSQDEYSQIMGSFTADMLPVFSTLARNFTIFDHWHCAVPSQTFCNRSFFHASTSHGFVTNALGGVRKWMDPSTDDAPTIFNRLEDAGIDWAVYYDDRQLISLTGLLHATVLEPYWKTNFHTMATFYEHVAAGTLPAYAFIEPRLLYDHNDMHPPVGPYSATTLDGEVVTGRGISDVRAGDALLHQVYSAIRQSGSPSGSNATNTAFLVTFDEHGGTYDHVPPPKATPPEPDAPAGEMDFTFDRLGVRVPALLVSAFAEQGRVMNDEMHHAAVIASLSERHGLDPLTLRDRDARTLSGALSLATGRDPSTWPVTTPMYVPKNPEADGPVHPGDEDHPLSPPGVGLISLLMARYGAPDEPIPTTYSQAWEAVRKHGEGLFGT